MHTSPLLLFCFPPPSDVMTSFRGYKKKSDVILHIVISPPIKTNPTQPSHSPNQKPEV